MRSKKLKALPRFRSEAEERKFREAHDSAAYVDWSKAGLVAFPNLRPTTKSISLRLPEHLLDAIRGEANRRDVPYQSLMKIWLAEKAAQAREGRRGRSGRG